MFALVKGMFKKAKRSKFIDFDIEQVFSELDIQEKEFHKVVKEDSQEVFSEEETDKIMSYCHRYENRRTCCTATKWFYKW